MKKKASKIPAIAVLCLIFALSLSVSIAFAEDSPSVTLEINYGEYEGNDLPVGKAGLSYEVFGYSAIDENGGKVTDVSVYVYAPDGKLLPVKGGRFETATVGGYKIEYVAKHSDVVEKKTVNITVSDEDRPLIYEISDKIGATAHTGETVFLPDGTMSGGIGLVNAETTVTLGKNASELFAADGGKYFVPKKRGDYVLSYSLTDFVGQKESFTFTISVADLKKPLVSFPSVPKTVKKGNALSLPVVDGILYDGDNVYYLPVKVLFDETDITKEMKCVPETVGAHVVTYICENPFDKSFKEEYVFDVEVIADGEDELVFDKHFAFENFESVSTPDDDAYVLSAAGNGSASFSFDSALPVSRLDIGMTGVPSASGYSSAKLILTDMKNAADKVEIRLGKIGSSFYVKYDEESSSLVDIDEKVFAEIGYYADGRKFEGFKSGRAYISVVFDGIDGETEIILDVIGTHNVTTATDDFGAPVFLDNDKYRSVNLAYMGQTVELPLMKAYDLFDSSAVVSITITAPDKTVVFSGEMTKPYILKADKYGTYNVRYVASDAAGNARPLVCSVYCMDITPPEIEVGKMPSTVKVGGTITLPEAKITDNATLTEKILSYVYVYYGNNIRTLVTNGSFTFKKAGEYTIRYVAYDEFENYTIAEFTVICK